MEGSTLPLSWQDKCKLARLKVKAWEGEYVAANKARPDKAALAAAPDNIKAAYKTYFYYRKRMESGDASAGQTEEKETKDTHENSEHKSDGTQQDSNEGSKQDFEEVSQQPKESEGTKLASNLDNNKSSLGDPSTTLDAGKITPTSVPKPSSGIWGKHLNKEACLSRATSKNVNSPGSLYSKMAEKMRASGTIKMRTSLKKFSNIDRSTKSEASKNVVNPSVDLDSKNDTTDASDKQNASQSTENTDSVVRPFEETPGKSVSETKASVFDSFSETKASVFDSFSESKMSVFDSLNDFEEKASNNLDSESGLFNSSASKLPFRFQKKTTTQKMQTQAISALSLTPERLEETHAVKRKGALNRGWLLRCTGADVEEGVGAEVKASDDWRLKLIDREWTEDDNKEDAYSGEFKDEHFQDNFGRGHTPNKELHPNRTSGKRKELNTVEKRQTNTSHTTEDFHSSNSVDCNKKDIPGKDLYDFNEGLSNHDAISMDVAMEIQEEVKTKRYQKVNSKANSDLEEQTVPANEEGIPEERVLSVLNNQEQESNVGDTETTAPRKRGRPRVKKVDAGEVENASPAPRRRGKPKVKGDDAEVTPAPKNSKRKRKETLEELEASGKIQSSWPPPKKVRNSKAKARKNIEELNVTEKASDDTAPEKAVAPEDGFNEYNELDDIEKHGTKAAGGKAYLSKEERFRKKITTGSANNNFVRINLKKKTFVRGHKHINGSKYRRMEWKRKQSLKSGESMSTGKSFTCFKCGDFGHWARFCPGKKGDKLLALEEYDENESTFLSLEDAAAMALGIKPSDQNPSTTKMYSNVDEVSTESGLDVTSTEQENNEEPALEAEATQPETCEGAQGGTSMEDDFQMDADDDLFADIDEDKLDENDSQPTQLSSQPSYEGGDDSIISKTTEITTYPTSHEQNWYGSRPSIEPLYELVDGEIGPTPAEVHETLKMFGYPSFRAGQENAIMRILSGQSTLLVLSTGSGKSLCYQLPAYLYAKHNNCITLCVSPLVSLMEDQVTGLPKFLHAVCLHTHQNPTQRSNAVNAIRSGKAQILLISPEAVVASRTGGVLGTLLRELPPVAFACLDEAHCVSEWSHNFRPSYLRICQVLRERLGVKTILGLTATARHATAISIAKHLLVPDFDTGIIRGRGVPDNLKLSVSRDQNREQALVSLLQGDRFSNCSSIIIYCTRRDECERVATLIRTQLLNPTKVDVKSNLKRTKGISMDAEAYHAGLSSHRRQQVQKKFMSGKLRIVVATVAFGMGIDKSDVRGIIHFNMPRNVESYVQEIGRAGRDGEEAHCHLFLDSLDGKDIQELKRHIFVNSMDRHTVRKLLNKLFKPCTCAKVRNLQDSCHTNDAEKNESGAMSTNESAASENMNDNLALCASNPDSFAVTFSQSSCPKHEVAIPIDGLVEELDLPAENIETLLCYLELHQSKLISIKSPVYATGTVSCYAGPRQLVAVSRKCPPLGVAIALERQKGNTLENKNQVVFPVVEIASRMGWDSKIVKKELKALEWTTHDLSAGGKVKRSGVTVEFSDLSYHMYVRGDLSDDECDQLLDALYLRTQTQERDQLRQVQYTYQLLRSVSHGSMIMCCDSVDDERGNRLREELREYFKEGSKVLSEVPLEEQVYIRPEIETAVRSSVRAVLSTHLDNQWTGRAIARVFHGIGSPNFPAEVWGRVRRFWRLHLNVDFNILVKLATQEIIRFK
ncbi:ATP-dependent DNA helicase Q4-like [Penaeus japonicus]|uniref:ATP-dependent DNA helicase Q4-like n=1 Tax=Penaeus japonicus TaxID=27405 RepID=UPI001C717AE5|nr:ATP-dependent DNA helicase Q4-like [Penaeus japonicus]XP_042865249.1 ATP-dependent DNA helicase Q4-like [Penaeus japonicus]